MKFYRDLFYSYSPLCFSLYGKTPDISLSEKGKPHQIIRNKELNPALNQKDIPVVFENSGFYRREKAEKLKQDQYKIKKSTQKQKENHNKDLTHRNLLEKALIFDKTSSLQTETPLINPEEGKAVESSQKNPSFQKPNFK